MRRPFQVLVHRPTPSGPRLLRALFAGAALAALTGSLPQKACAADAPQTGSSEGVQPAFTVRPKQHIAVLGGAAADALLQDGYWEALLHARFPQHELVVRNLALPGEVASGRPSPVVREEWLARVEADVALLFFGGAESLAGKAGLEAFKSELTALVKKLRSGGSAGKKMPELVLFGLETLPASLGENGPIDALNANRKLYSEAVAAVAQETGVPFVDLFELTGRVFATGAQRSALLPARWGAPRHALLSSAGYLTEEAHRLLAPTLLQATIGGAVPMPAVASESLRPAVVAKNAEWQALYRSAQAGPGSLKELAALEARVSKLDSLLWASAKGEKTAVPAPRSAAPNGTVTAAPEERFKLQDGLAVRLFADASHFPELRDPVQLGWDSEGRLLVLCHAATSDADTTPLEDRIVRLEDTDGDGTADRAVLYADGLHHAGAFAFHRDGVLVEQAGDLWLLRDATHAGKAQERERVLMGLGVANASSSPARLFSDTRGAVYWSDPGSHRSRIETATGILPEARGGVFRFEPLTGRVETLLASGGEKAPGSVAGPWGTVLFADAKAAYWHWDATVHGRQDALPKQANWPRVWDKAPAPVTGAAIVSGAHLPEALQGALLASTTAKPAGIRRMEASGARAAELLSCEEPGFLPRALASAPDGTLFFAEGGAGEGRIYRISTKDKAPEPTASLAGLTTEQLLNQLRSPEPGTRERARHALASRSSAELLDALNAWSGRLDSADPLFEQLHLEALWLSRWTGKLDNTLLAQALRSPEPRVRAQAVRILAEARSSAPNLLQKLAPFTEDKSALVRLEVLAAAAASPNRPLPGVFLTDEAAPAADHADAVKVVHHVLGQPLEPALERVAREALRVLEPDPAKMIVPSEPKVARFVLERLSNAELIKAPGAEFVWQAQLERAGLADNVREQALQGLAKKRGTSPAAELATALLQMDTASPEPTGSSADLTRLLLNKSAAELSAATAPLEKLASAARNARLRKVAHAVWLQSAPPAQVWASAAQPPRQAELLESLLLVREASARAACQPLAAAVLRSPSPEPRLFQAALKALPLTGTAAAGENFALIAGVLQRGQAVPEAALALAQLPEATLSEASLEPVVSALSKWLESAQADSKNSQAFAQTLQVAQTLGSLWEARVAQTVQAVRKQESAVCVIRTVFDQARFDTARWEVRAGRTFQLVFENADAQPQNLVLVAPGKRAEILREAARMGGEPDAEGRKFVPKHADILAATRLLEPGEKQTLELKAPTTEGEYEFLCTVPGRSDTLRGILSVKH